jgi:GTP cyclohydrolase I
MVTVKLRFRKFFWIEDVIRLIEESASSEIYSLLKRVDEKYVTEKAYENPLFVEDVVRNVAGRLNRDDNFIWYSVEVENMESIHNHSAYAFVEKDAPLHNGKDPQQYPPDDEEPANPFCTGDKTRKP